MLPLLTHRALDDERLTGHRGLELRDQISTKTCRFEHYQLVRAQFVCAHDCSTTVASTPWSSTSPGRRKGPYVHLGRNELAGTELTLTEAHELRDHLTAVLTDAVLAQ